MYHLIETQELTESSQVWKWNDW